MLVNFLQDLHKATKRDYLARMNDDKVHCMQVARRFDKDFFDGDRRYGYGGYKYDGRWKPVAEKIVEYYDLNKNCQVLDLGCGKGFLAYEIQKLTSCMIEGFEISDYAISQAKIKVFPIDIRGLYFTFTNDLILCINVLHNFILPDLRHTLNYISQSSKNSYICLDSYRNEQELFNLQCWALTAEQFLRPEEWEWLFKKFNYTGDWEFIFYE